VGKVTKSTPFGSLDASPSTRSAWRWGPSATFVARTHDMDRKHMHGDRSGGHREHRGASFVEIFQNCNVFNDGAFTDVTGKSVRSEMLIPLVDGQPARFGEDGHAGVHIDLDGARVVEVDEVGAGSLYVHEERRVSPTAAMALALMAPEPTEPTPMGIFRDVSRAGASRCRGDRSGQPRRPDRHARVGHDLDGRLAAGGGARASRLPGADD
jgi:2-oxoglutarate ferredoxin oxidoreductase subunit beta